MSNVPAVCVVGSIGLDTIKTPCAERIECLGGSLSYACVAAAKFVTTGMVGVVGTDFPDAYRDLYLQAGIDVSGLHTAEGKTFRWSGVYDADMINRTTLSTELNVFEHFSPRLPQPFCASPFLLLGNISPELQLHVLSQVETPRFVVADTMDLWINIARAPLVDLIGKVDMLMLNDAEARLLTGRHSLWDCALAVREMGTDYVVIKKGEHGALLFSQAGAFVVPAFPVKDIVDPTGAGDCFAGAFLGALAQNGTVSERNVRHALYMGAVVASFNVEAFSLDRILYSDPSAIDRRFESLCAMTQLSVHP